MIAPPPAIPPRRPPHGHHHPRPPDRAGGPRRDPHRARRRVVRPRADARRPDHDRLGDRRRRRRPLGPGLPHRDPPAPTLLSATPAPTGGGGRPARPAD